MSFPSRAPDCQSPAPGGRTTDALTAALRLVATHRPAWATALFLLLLAAD